MVRLMTALVLAAAATVTANQPPRLWPFDGAPAGALPDGFVLSSFRQSTPGRWSVEGGALRHPGGDGSGWGLALAPHTATTDFRLTGRVRVNSGAKAAGLVWHYQDARHFMAAVLDLGHGEISLYRVWEGNRIKLDDRDGLELDAEAWHTLRVTQQDDRIHVSIGGIRVLNRDDRRRPGGNGQVGVLATGATTAAFDDLRVESLRNGRSPH